MMGALRQVLALAVLAVVLSACAGQQGPSSTTSAAPGDSGVEQFVAERRAAAKRLEAADDLAGALVDWRLVSAVRPRDSEANAQIQRLESVIEKRKDSYLAQADNALAKGRESTARTLYLKVLALDGSDPQALRHLRDMEWRSVLSNQKKKDEKALAEYRASHAKPVAGPTEDIDFDKTAAGAFSKGNYRRVIDLADQHLKNYPEDSSAASYRERSYVALAQESRQSGNLRAALKFLEAASETPAGEQAEIEKTISTVKSEIAVQLYSDGVDQMNSNLDRAIELLSEALTFDPNYLAAHQRLDQAQRMRARLQSIK